MQVKWKLLRKSVVGETNFSVRFFTDILTEEKMCLTKDEEGNITQTRLDYLIQIPLDPKFVPRTEADLHTLVMHSCPYQWMLDEEKRILHDSKTEESSDLADVISLINELSSDTNTIEFPSYYPRPLKTNDEWKAFKKKIITEKRDALILSGGFKLVSGGNTYWFHSNSISTCQQLGLISAAIIAKMQNAPDNTILHPIPWRTLGGVTISLTVGVALSLLSASFAQQGFMFAAAEAHKAAIDASADARSYDVEANWPETYQTSMAIPSV